MVRFEKSENTVTLHCQRQLASPAHDPRPGSDPRQSSVHETNSRERSLVGHRERKLANTTLEPQETSDSITITTDEVEVVIRRSPLLIEFRDARTRQLLNADERPMSYDAKGPARRNDV